MDFYQIFFKALYFVLALISGAWCLWLARFSRDPQGGHFEAWFPEKRSRWLGMGFVSTILVTGWVFYAALKTRAYLGFILVFLMILFATKLGLALWCYVPIRKALSYLVQERPALYLMMASSLAVAIVLAFLGFLA